MSGKHATPDVSDAAMLRYPKDDGMSGMNFESMNRVQRAAFDEGRQSIIDKVNAILDRQVAPYGDTTVPTWSERKSLTDLYGDDFVERLEEALR